MVRVASEGKSQKGPTDPMQRILSQMAARLVPRS